MSSNQWDKQNYYDILEVAPHAPETEIRKAYQRAKTTYSGDNPSLFSVFSKEEMKELQVLIEEAFSVLSNQASRVAYDQNITRTGIQNRSVAAHFLSQSFGNTAAKDIFPEFSFDEGAGLPAPGPAPVQITHKAGANAAPSNATARTTAQSTVPEGFLRTPLSIYKYSEEMESRIHAQNVYDGPFLASVRQYKNIDIDKMSEYTKINKPYLQALERDDFQDLPAPVFVRGFVIQVARLLSLDEHKVAKSYMEIFKAARGI